MTGGKRQETQRLERKRRGKKKKKKKNNNNKNKQKTLKQTASKPDDDVGFNTPRLMSSGDIRDKRECGSLIAQVSVILNNWGLLPGVGMTSPGRISHAGYSATKEDGERERELT